MSATPPTATKPPGVAPSKRPADAPGRRAILSRVVPADGAMVLVAALSLVLNTHRLARNGYANIYYSAGVKSMLHSLHDFLYLSYDPGGLISVDKPPLGLWVQVVSAKIFGYSHLSLLLPEALLGVVAVIALYAMLRNRLGSLAALGAALALAVFPSFVAASRDNGVDPLLLTLLVLACAAALRASETGSWKALLTTAVLVGLAFNTKTLAAYLVVPAIAAGYFVCAPGSLRRRAVRLAAAGVLTLVVSFAWIAFVELTPASQRPFVGGSTDNSELGLTFNYNGLGRVEGQVGGPGQVPVRAGAFVPAVPRTSGAIAHPPLAATQRLKGAVPRPPPGAAPTGGREPRVIAFGTSPGPLRLFRHGLGDQAAWYLPYALFGVLGFALLLATLLLARRGRTGLSLSRGRGRHDPRLACLLVLGGWFLTEVVVLSASKGIVHPYYVSAIAPGAAAMAGAGALSFAQLATGPRRLVGVAFALCAIAGTIAVQVVLMHQQQYKLWLIPVLIAGGGLAGLVLVLSRRFSAGAIAASFLLLLATPAAYATTTWLAPVEGTFPVAGAKHNAGAGGYGVTARQLAIDRALVSYILSHHPGRRWALLTVASEQAAPMMMMGLDAGALAGYSGTDPALDGPGLARLIEEGNARYVLLGGAYSLRGGNRATIAVLQACKQIHQNEWRSPSNYTGGIALFDCRGRERELVAAKPLSPSALANGEIRRRP
jgi:4-amino-4-deoxy-L-arabinose transferase-like glycosyltransferase